MSTLRVSRFPAAYATTLLRSLGEDPSRPGLRGTAVRVARSLERQTPNEAVGGAMISEDHTGLVLVKDTEFDSLCEHHMLPLFGRAHVGHLALSKRRAESNWPRPAATGGP